jgi:uncharacterized protein (DUF1810 family)
LTKSPIEEIDMDDPYNLQRFVDAQSSCFGNVLSELRNGSKRSHWMWFIFPQIEGLGFSPLARKFAISSRAEAEAFLRHPILGPRLRECALLVNLTEGRSLHQIFGNPDDLKFRSCVTLFAHATQDNQVFIDALQKYCEGKFDSRTLDRLQSTSSDIAP